MYQNYNYYPQQTQQPQVPVIPQQTVTPRQFSLKGRPVSSVEEARASTVDFDGSIFYFPDLASKRIYTKQINVDGTAVLKTYELIELPPEQPNVSNDKFVTRDEFETVISQIKSILVPPKEEIKPF